MSRANYDPPPSPSLAAWPRRVPFSPFPVTTSAVLRKRLVVVIDGTNLDVAHAVREAGKVFVNSFFEDVKSYELLNASDAFVNLSHVRWESIRLQQDRRY